MPLLKWKALFLVWNAKFAWSDHLIKGFIDSSNKFNQIYKNGFSLINQTTYEAL